MTKRDPVEVANLDRYGNPALAWSRARDALADKQWEHRTFFLGTVGPDGRPHVAGEEPGGATRWRFDR